MVDVKDAGWKKELKDLMKAIAAASLFGIPLLYTMEMWELGVTVSSQKLAVLIGVAILVNFLASLAWGVREDCTPFGAFADAVTSIGIGFVFSTAILALIGRLDLGRELDGSLAKITLMTIVVSIGITFATSRFRDDANGEGDDEEKERKGKSEDELHKLQLQDDLADLGGSVAGALIFAFNVAPTEEITLIASTLGSLQLVTLLAAELLLGYVILFASGLWKRTVYVEDTIFQKPWAETVMSTAIGLVVAGALLAFFGYQEAGASTSGFVATLVTLGLPATIGAAAGRLVV